MLSESLHTKQIHFWKVYGLVRQNSKGFCGTVKDFCARQVVIIGFSLKKTQKFNKMQKVKFKTNREEIIAVNFVWCFLVQYTMN